jgi:N-ATPase, AtpR subunit
MAMDIVNISVGLGLGMAASLVFFAGLAYGVRLALNTALPGAVLITSAAIRLSLLLYGVWIAIQVGGWSLIGFGAAFLAIRFIIVKLARAPWNKRRHEWN